MLFVPLALGLPEWWLKLSKAGAFLVLKIFNMFVVTFKMYCHCHCIVEEQLFVELRRMSLPMITVLEFLESERASVRPCC